MTIAFYTAAGTKLVEVSGERTVDPNGELFLPFLGTVSVVGMESAHIRRLLEEHCGALYSNPVVEVVTLVNVNITGAVRSPGQYFGPAFGDVGRCPDSRRLEQIDWRCRHGGCRRQGIWRRRRLQ